MVNIMQSLNHFPGCSAQKKISIVFMFFSWCASRFCAHFSASGSLFRRLAKMASIHRSKIAFLVNDMKFYELGQFNRYFQTGIFIGALEGRIGEHKKRPNFTLLHFLGTAYG